MTEKETISQPRAPGVTEMSRLVDDVRPYVHPFSPFRLAWLPCVFGPINTSDAGSRHLAARSLERRKREKEMDDDDAASQDGEQGLPVAMLCDELLLSIFSGSSSRSGRFYLGLRHRWAVAFVCRRWRSVVRAANGWVDTPERHRWIDEGKPLVWYEPAVRGRIVWLSTIASMAPRLSIMQIDGLRRYAHDLDRALLAAVLLTLESQRRMGQALDWAEAHASDRGWQEVHDYFDRARWQWFSRSTRVRPALSCDIVITHRELGCDHETRFCGRSMCCVLVAAALWQPPALVERLATLYKGHPRGIVRPLAHAVARDRVDVVQRLGGHHDALCRRLSLDNLDNYMFRATNFLWQTAAGCGSIKTADYMVQLGGPDGHNWPKGRRRGGHRPGGEVGRGATRAVSRDDTRRVQIIRNRWGWVHGHLHEGALHDVPAVIDFYCGSLYDAGRAPLGVAFRVGSVAFCERLLVLCPRLLGEGEAQRIFSRCVAHGQFNMHTIEWLLAQPWYEPLKLKEVEVIVDTVCQRANAAARRTLEWRYGRITAPAQMTALIVRVFDRWPWVASRLLAHPTKGVQHLLVLCAAHDDWVTAERLVDMVIDYDRRKKESDGVKHDVKHDMSHADCPAAGHARGAWDAMIESARTCTILADRPHCRSCADTHPILCIDALIQCCRPTRRPLGADVERLQMWNRLCDPRPFSLARLLDGIPKSRSLTEHIGPPPDLSPCVREAIRRIQSSGLLLAVES